MPTLIDKSRFEAKLKQKEAFVKEITLAIQKFYADKGKKLPAGDIIMATSLALISDFHYPDLTEYAELRRFLNLEFEKKGLMDGSKFENTQDRMYYLSVLQNQAVMTIFAVQNTESGEQNATK